MQAVQPCLASPFPWFPFTIFTRKWCKLGVACPEHFTTEVAVLEPATGTVMDSPKQPHRRVLKESPTIYPTSLMPWRPWRPWWPWQIRLRLVPLNNSTIEVETHSRLSVLGRQWSVLGVFKGLPVKHAFGRSGYVLSRTPCQNMRYCSMWQLLYCRTDQSYIR